MLKKDFLELTDKFQRGECTDQEKSILFEFCERAQIKDLMSDWDLSREEESRVRLLRRINDTIRHGQYKRQSKRKWRKLAPIAAIFIGLIATGLFYLQSTTNNNIDIPEGAITLELEDGTIEILEEDGYIEVVDKQGKVVGEQHGKEISYVGANTTEELIYNTLTVPYGKTFELRLSDGTQAHLNAGSSLKYPVNFIKGLQREVFINGEVYLDVAKDSLRPFIVSAENLNVRVLGTRFNVSAYPEDDTAEIVLVEGSVGLYRKSEKFENAGAVFLEPGFKGSFDKNNGSISKDSVMTDIYTAWVNGKLVFRNMKFKNILKKLERHYNVIIDNQNKELSEKLFNANFGKEPIMNVLKELETFYDIHYTIDNETIIIE